LRSEIRFAGVGGQGNILAGEWVALAAHNMGLNALQSPTYTAQVRGGPTSVDVLIDNEPIGYPRLTEIDFFLCLAQGAWNLFANHLRDDSIVVVDPNLVPKMSRGPQMIYSIPIIQITKQIVERPVYTSAVSLGIFCRLLPIIPMEEMMQTIEQNAPAGTVEKNILAFRTGYELIDKYNPIPRDELAMATVK